MSQEQQQLCTPSDYEPTPSEKMLFGERKEEPKAPVVIEAVREDPPEGEEITISQMIENACPILYDKRVISNEDAGFYLKK